VLLACSQPIPTWFLSLPGMVPGLSSCGTLWLQPSSHCPSRKPPLPSPTPGSQWFLGTPSGCTLQGGWHLEV
jgi:hypothetical protein